ncbi:MAG: hypothetical protein NT011_12720 [Kiritimatiellaeota bacterium]|nr:hypothetical protein [Kiritimatiellota bacterium]
MEIKPLNRGGASGPGLNQKRKALRRIFTIYLGTLGGLALLIGGCQNLGASAKDKADAKALMTLRAERREMAHRPRRLILNNDGDDQIFAKAPTREAFLEVRTTPLADSQVDTIIYCTSLPFGLFAHRSQEGEILTLREFPNGKGGMYRSIVADFLEQGTDPLQVMVEWCRAHGREIFWTMRMNDVHDTYYPYLLPKFKREHPQYLLGTSNKPPCHGNWTAVDYGEPEVRDRLVGYLREICRNYNVDGIEMDFFRSLVFFRPVAEGGEAGDAERGMMTDMVRKVRRMTEEEGLRRGRPILVSARTPDSIEFCRAIGLDLERWMQEGLLDIWVVGGDFRLNPWPENVALGHRHGLTIWCDLDPVVHNAAGRWNRNAIESMRARALEAWSAGADGVYFFNFYDQPKDPMWRELGDPRTLAKADQVIFANVMGRTGFMSADGALAEGHRFETVSMVHPDNPMQLRSHQTQRVLVPVGADPQASSNGAADVEARCHLLLNGVNEAGELRVSLNGKVLDGGVLVKDWWEAPVPPGLLRGGTNAFDIVYTPPSDKGVGAGKNTNETWNVVYRGDHVMQYPQQLPWRRLTDCKQYVEEIRNGALYLADLTAGDAQMINLAYPWMVSPGERIVVEARVKVLASDDPTAVCLRMADGASVEILALEKDGVRLLHAGLKHGMNTTDAFHTYRVEILGKDIRVYVDGGVALDGAGRFTAPVTDKGNEMPLGYGLRYWNRCSLLWGSASGPGRGEALWEFVRFRQSGVLLHDVVLTLHHRGK